MMVIYLPVYLPVKFEFDWTKNGQMNKWNYTNFERNLVDGQTDVGHINLISGLVTCNPPKNVCY